MAPITGTGLKPRSATSYSDLEQPTSPVSRNGRPHGQIPPLSLLTNVRRNRLCPTSTLALVRPHLEGEPNRGS